MALLFLDSFDHYDTAHLQHKYTAAAGTIVPSLGRCGTQALQMTSSDNVSLGVTFGSASATFGCAFKWTGVFGPNFLYVGTTTHDHLWLQLNHGDGSLSVHREAWPGNVIVGTTAPGLIALNTWYFIEWQMTISQTVGAVALRVNNVPVLSLSGINTNGQNADASYVPAELRKFTFMCPINAGYFLDDLYVLDSTGPAPLNTFLGDCRVEYLRPRAAGSSQQWTVVGSASHYAAVDDNAAPDNDATYIESATPDQIDTNYYQPTGLPSGPIFGAQLHLLAKKTEPGPRIIAPVANSVVGASFGPSYDAYHYAREVYPTNPATGLAWTIATINAAQFGVKVIS